MFDVGVHNKPAERLSNRCDLLLTAHGVLSLKTQLGIANNLAVGIAHVGLSQFLVGNLYDGKVASTTAAPASKVLGLDTIAVSHFNWCDKARIVNRLPHSGTLSAVTTSET